jgi:thiamine biosynthesis lipoprotein
VRVGAGAIATSGTYERGAHLWDGRTGSAAEPLASMTVVGPELAWADAFATTAYVLGADDGLAFVAAVEGYEALAVRPDRTLVGTPGMRALLATG